jgi:hypothetical protein
VSTIVPLLTDWLGFLRGERENPVPGEEGVAAVCIAEACLRSAAKEGWETVGITGNNLALGIRRFPVAPAFLIDVNA